MYLLLNGTTTETWNKNTFIMVIHPCFCFVYVMIWKLLYRGMNNPYIAGM